MKTRRFIAAALIVLSVASVAFAAGRSIQGVLFPGSGVITAAGASSFGAPGVLTQLLGTLNVDEAVTLDTTLGVTGVATFTASPTSPGGANSEEWGDSASAGGANALASGTSSSAAGDDSLAVGQGASAAHDDSQAHGRGAATTATQQSVFGSASAPILEFQTGTTTQSANLAIRSVTELHTLTAAGTSVTAALVPAGCRALFTACYVSTEVTGCTTIQVGDGSDADRFGTGILLTVGTTVDETDATADPSGWSASTQAITFTAVGGGASFTAGVITTTVWYLDPKPPGS